MTFDNLNLNKPLLNALDDLGFIRPTTIQEKAFSVIMSGRDVVGIAQTGTGKTLAYLLPCLRLWEFSSKKVPQIVILVPTRELVVQIVEEIQKLIKYMNLDVVGVYGGTNIKTQADLVNKGLDVIVGTPGRLLDLALHGILRLKSVKRLIIDEVDEMLDLGFRYQLTSILDILPPKRQNLMFSATITEEVDKLIQGFFNNPIQIEAAPTGTPLENILQKGYLVPNFYTKVNLIENLVAKNPEFKKVLVFCATKKMADQLYDNIYQNLKGHVGIIHSGKTQNNRFKAVQQFHEGTTRVLIATDLIARGLDISEVSHVINFDTPDVAETHIHRIGRTGRADKNGNAITFITKSDIENIEAIEALMKQKIPLEALPEGLNISEILTPDEKPKNKMKIIKVKLPKRDLAGPAFHEKKEKNKKVNVHTSRAESMKKKYKKPKTKRG